MRLVAKMLFVVLVAWIAGNALYPVVDSGSQSPVFERIVTDVPWAGHCHIIAGALALILGVFQLSSRFRRHYIRSHQRIGYAYVGCVLVSTIGALGGLPVSKAPFAAMTAFWMLAIVWPIITLAGIPWRGDFNVKRHGRLMTYSYALTAAAISLRLILMPLMAFGVRFHIAYPIAAWGSILGNLAVAFVIFRMVDASSKRSPAVS